MPFGRRGTCILPFKTTESDMIGVIRGDALHFEALASNPRGAQTMVCAAAAQGWNGAIGVMLDEYSDYFTADDADVKNYTPLGRAAMTVALPRNKRASFWGCRRAASTAAAAFSAAAAGLTATPPSSSRSAAITSRRAVRCCVAMPRTPRARPRSWSLAGTTTQTRRCGWHTSLPAGPREPAQPAGRILNFSHAYR